MCYDELERLSFDFTAINCSLKSTKTSIIPNLNLCRVCWKTIKIMFIKLLCVIILIQVHVFKRIILKNLAPLKFWSHYFILLLYLAYITLSSRKPFFNVFIYIFKRLTSNLKQSWLFQQTLLGSPKSFIPFPSDLINAGDLHVLKQLFHLLKE